MLPEGFLLPPSTPGTSASASNASVKLETHKCCQKEKLVEEGVVMERTITAILLLVATVWNITLKNSCCLSNLLLFHLWLYQSYNVLSVALGMSIEMQNLTTSSLNSDFGVETEFVAEEGCFRSAAALIQPDYVIVPITKSATETQRLVWG